MKYAQIREMDIANGEKIRTSVYFSGCNFNCYNCFNKEYQDFNYGKEWTPTIQDKFINIINRDFIDGASILGGEPMQQDSSQMLKLVKEIKEKTGKTIWMWTGYKFEDLIHKQDKLEILKYVDILVDGRYVDEERDISLRFRGSKSQRVINVKESLKQGKAIKYID